MQKKKSKLQQRLQQTTNLSSGQVLLSEIAVKTDADMLDYTESKMKTSQATTVAIDEQNTTQR